MSHTTLYGRATAVTDSPGTDTDDAIDRHTSRVIHSHVGADTNCSRLTAGLVSITGDGNPNRATADTANTTGAGTTDTPGLGVIVGPGGEPGLNNPDAAAPTIAPTHPDNAFPTNPAHAGCDTDDPRLEVDPEPEPDPSPTPTWPPTLDVELPDEPPDPGDDAINVHDAPEH